ncbi:hypothetical protein AAMO2058_000062900 [Amorphochlora amoebiformis]
MSVICALQILTSLLPSEPYHQINPSSLTARAHKEKFKKVTCHKERNPRIEVTRENKRGGGKRKEGKERIWGERWFRENCEILRK